MVWGGHRPAGPWIILSMYYFSTVAHYRGTGRREEGLGWSPSCWSLDCPPYVLYLNSCSLYVDEEEGPMVWGGHRPAGPWIILYMNYFSTVVHYRWTRRDPWSGVVNRLAGPWIILYMLFFLTVAHYRVMRRRDPWSGVVIVLPALYVSVAMENRYFL
jgi:hypothetical protein